MKKRNLFLAFALLLSFANTKAQDKYTELTASALSGNASLAVDNDNGTRWESSHGIDPQWLIIDLGEVKTVNAVKIYWEAANAQDYSISYSTDGSVFSNEEFFTGKAEGNRTDVITDIDVDCRYVKINGTKRNLGYGYSIFEVEVFPPVSPVLSRISISPNSTENLFPGASIQFDAAGYDQFEEEYEMANPTIWSATGVGSIDENGLYQSSEKGIAVITANNSGVTSTVNLEVLPVNGNLCVGAIATASNVKAGSDINFAIDNNPGTRWETIDQDPQWMIVDLGATKNISDIIIRWETASAKDYTIEWSINNADWTTLISNSNMAGTANRVDRFYNQNIQARFVKINGSSRTTPYGYSIWELEIYGTDNAFYRTKNSGNWNDATNWEVSTDNINWSETLNIPSNTNKSITIDSEHEFVISSNSSATEINIQPGAKLTINNVATLNAGVLKLKSSVNGTATFIDNGNANINNVEAEQYLTTGRNWYVSSPMKNASTSSLSSAGSVVSYDETSGNWITETATLSPLKGYISAATNTTGNITFTGQLNTGTLSTTLSRTSGIEKPGFHLIGNPYPSYLDWSMVSLANPEIYSTIWYRTKTTTDTYTFASYNVSGDIVVTNNSNTAISKYIPPLQAFWVRVKPDNASAQLSVTNAMRTHAIVTENKLKSPAINSRKVIRLEVSNGVNIDETVIYFDENASNQIDGFDSPKMLNNNASVPDIYSFWKNEKLVINGLKSPENGMEIALGFNTLTKNSFAINITEFLNLQDVRVFLKDILLNNEIELTNGVSYQFDSELTNTTNRFSILFRSASLTTDVLQKNKQSVSIYKKGKNKIVIDSSIATDNEATVFIHNISGILIKDISIKNKLTEIESNLLPGVYMVTYRNGSYLLTTKLIIDEK